MKQRVCSSHSGLKRVLMTVVSWNTKKRLSDRGWQTGLPYRRETDIRVHKKTHTQNKKEGDKRRRTQLRFPQCQNRSPRRRCSRVPSRCWRPSRIKGDQAVRHLIGSSGADCSSRGANPFSQRRRVLLTQPPPTVVERSSAATRFTKG